MSNEAKVESWPAHTHTLSCKWSRNTFASTRRFRSFKGRSKDVRDETSRRSFQWKYIYFCTSCKVATSFSSLISTRVQREAGRSHTLTRNVNNVSSNGCLPRSIRHDGSRFFDVRSVVRIFVNEPRCTEIREFQEDRKKVGLFVKLGNRCGVSFEFWNFSKC